MLDVHELQDRHRAWQRHWPAGARPPQELLLGIVEELGELCHAQLKELQGIRGTATEHEAAAKDALGDMFIFMVSYANARGWDLERIINDTWAQVSRRDWTADPLTGGEDA